MIYLDLFLAFLQVGCFSFGGGYGAIPLIRDVALSHGWLSASELTSMIAIGESTPGPIMVNLATFVGASQGGVFGAALATLGACLPAFFIIILIMIALNDLLNNRYVKAVLLGLMPCAVGIIASTGFYMVLSDAFAFTSDGVFVWQSLVLTIVLGTILFGSRWIARREISPITFIVVAAALGIVVYGL